ncbi:MAG: polynucleotide adenylyltransferase, partial [Lachnospiraceae bacterium]|nr:polynucleotide adenylyltransferase [Lachnospiraceae bacterium]
MKIILPDTVKELIDVITKAGYEAYAVGGCIRDSILGRVPEDYDITTSAEPSEIKALFR